MKGMGEVGVKKAVRRKEVIEGEDCAGGQKEVKEGGGDLRQGKGKQCGEGRNGKSGRSGWKKSREWKGGDGENSKVGSK